LNAAQRFPRRRSALATNQSDAVGISCLLRIVPPAQAAFAIGGSDAKYALSGVLPPCAV
jgi:hypothetical protein